MKSNLLLIAVIVGLISKEDWRNILAFGWSYLKILKWFCSGKPQGWFR